MSRHNAGWPLRGAHSLAAFLWIISCAPWSGAADITVQNDSIPPGTPLLAFNAGERAAGWLTMPVAGDIVGVELFWSSLFGGAPPSLETAITISSAGVFPAPGATLATIVTPTLLDAGSNVFQHLDPPANTMPLQVAVTAGQVIVVDIVFLNTNANNMFAPSIEFDADGCQNGLNSVFAIPGGWVDSCLAGVTGDFGIRAILRPVPEPSCVGLGMMGGLSLLVATRRRRDPMADDSST